MGMIKGPEDFLCCHLATLVLDAMQPLEINTAITISLALKALHAVNF